MQPNILPVPAQTVDVSYCQRPNQPTLLMMTVDSDVMAPLVTFGDVIMFDPSVQKVDRDGLYLFHLNGAVVMRRVTIVPHTGFLKISADNPKYHTAQDEPCRSSDVEVVARVVWIAKDL